MLSWCILVYVASSLRCVGRVQHHSKRINHLSEKKHYTQRKTLKTWPGSNKLRCPLVRTYVATKSFRDPDALYSSNFVSWTPLFRSRTLNGPFSVVSKLIVATKNLLQSARRESEIDKFRILLETLSRLSKFRIN